MRILAITGAGISASSGLPTYRGEGGIYTEIERKTGARVEEVLSKDAFERDPGKVWEHWKALSLKIHEASPSPTHFALARLSAHYRIGKSEDFSASRAAILDATAFDTPTLVEVADQGCNSFVEVTQNVDGLSTIAGVHRKDVIELHGNYRQHWCTQCHNESPIQVHAELEIPPKCPVCKSPASVMRPKVVMFGERINPYAMSFSEDYASRSSVILIVGTSLQFHYLASFIRMAMNKIGRDPLLVYIDPHASPYKSTLLALESDFEIEQKMICIRKESDHVVPALVDFLVSKNPTEDELQEWSETAAKS